MQLKGYIKTLRKKGYSDKQIKSQLISYGYDKKEIEREFSHNKNILLIGIAVSMILLITLSILLLIPEKKQEKQEKTETRYMSEEFEKRCPLTCNDNKECTRDYCSFETDYQCVHEDIVPCCGNDICEKKENNNICPDDCEKIEKNEQPSEFKEELAFENEILNIKDTAKDDYEKAIEECKKIDEDEKRDTCLEAVFYINNNINICKLIEDKNKKDNCIMTYVLNKKEASFCLDISNQKLKNTCNSLFD